MPKVLNSTLYVSITLAECRAHRDLLEALWPSSHMEIEELSDLLKLLFFKERCVYVKAAYPDRFLVLENFVLQKMDEQAREASVQKLSQDHNSKSISIDKELCQEYLFDFQRLQRAPKKTITVVFPLNVFYTREDAEELLKTKNDVSEDQQHYVNMVGALAASPAVANFVKRCGPRVHAVSVSPSYKRMIKATLEEINLIKEYCRE